MAASPGIRRHVTLGRTGLEVSDIGFCSASSHDPELVRHALGRGVTFFDNAESYRFGWSEEAMGEGLRGVRGRVVVSSKTKAGARDTQDDMMAALEGSLRRLRTDYLDIYFNHVVNDVVRLQNAERRAFTERAKAQGKIRFLRHVRARQPACGMPGLRDRARSGRRRAGRLQLRSGPRFLRSAAPHLPLRRPAAGAAACARAGQGEGNRRRRDEDADERPPERCARLRAGGLHLRAGGVPLGAVQPARRCAPHLDEQHRAHRRVRGRLGRPRAPRRDLQLLDRYSSLQHGRYCRRGCDWFEGACPEGVDIAEVLRTRMYDVDYGDPALAVEDYAKLGAGASACLTCAYQACLGACPYSLPIPEFTRDTATRLG